MLRCLSRSIKVTAAASTGTEIANNQAVAKIDQAYKGSKIQQSNGSMVHLAPTTVPMKLTALARDDIPAKCTENITRSTDVPGGPTQVVKGAYSVQPAPQPLPIGIEIMKNVKEKGSSQKLELFNLGKTISGAAS